MMHECTKQKGQTLVEVVVVLGVVVLLITGIVAASIAALKASQSNRARSIATKLTQEALEIARADRDAGWSTFITLVNSDYYCFGYSGGNSIPSFFPVLPAYPNPDIACLDNISIAAGIGPTLKFTRYARFTSTPYGANPVILVSITVKWDEGGIKRTSKAETYFTQWK